MDQPPPSIPLNAIRNNMISSGIDINSMDIGLDDNASMDDIEANAMLDEINAEMSKHSVNNAYEDRLQERADEMAQMTQPPIMGGRGGGDMQPMDPPIQPYMVPRDNITPPVIKQSAHYTPPPTYDQSLESAIDENFQQNMGQSSVIQSPSPSTLYGILPSMTNFGIEESGFLTKIYSVPKINIKFILLLSIFFYVYNYINLDKIIIYTISSNIGYDLQDYEYVLSALFFAIIFTYIRYYVNL
jgi:hypothetical protein